MVYFVVLRGHFVPLLEHSVRGILFQEIRLSGHFELLIRILFLTTSYVSSVDPTDVIVLMLMCSCV